MKYLYIVLSVIGFIVPNVFVFMESVESGNILLWANPVATLNGMFTSNISTAFVMDLLLVVLVFFIWSFGEAQKYRINHVGFVWLLTLLLGLAGTFPLFLYMKEKKRGTVSIDGRSKYGYTKVNR